MIVAQMLQTTPPERLEALHRQFSRGAGWDEFVLPLVGFVALVGLLAVLFQLQKRRQQVDVDNPRKLYRRLVHRLGLSAAQRDLLYRMASDLHLPNPSVLLLERRVFENQARRWREKKPATRRGDDQHIEELADKLFPAR